MAGGAISFRIAWAVNQGDVRKIFDALGEDLRDFSPAMLRIRAVLAEMFRKIFASEGAALGSSADVGTGVTDVSGGWAPDSPEVQRRKMRGGSLQATLRLSGALEEALTDAEGSTGSIRRVSPAREGLPRLFYGVRLPYAAPLNFGSRRRNLPARPFVGITEDAKDEILGVLDAHLRDRLAAAGAELDRRARVG